MIKRRSNSFQKIIFCFFKFRCLSSIINYDIKALFISAVKKYYFEELLKNLNLVKIVKLH